MIVLSSGEHEVRHINTRHVTALAAARGQGAWKGVCGPRQGVMKGWAEARERDRGEGRKEQGGGREKYLDGISACFATLDAFSKARDGVAFSTSASEGTSRPHTAVRDIREYV